jgi:hypothetical protein
MKIVTQRDYFIMHKTSVIGGISCYANNKYTLLIDAVTAQTEVKKTLACAVETDYLYSLKRC